VNQTACLQTETSTRRCEQGGAQHGITAHGERSVATELAVQWAAFMLVNEKVAANSPREAVACITSDVSKRKELKILQTNQIAGQRNQVRNQTKPNQVSVRRKSGQQASIRKRANNFEAGLHATLSRWRAKIALTASA
jgi:hypothetical protein